MSRDAQLLIFWCFIALTRFDLVLSRAGVQNGVLADMMEMMNVEGGESQTSMSISVQTESLTDDGGIQGLSLEVNNGTPQAFEYTVNRDGTVNATEVDIDSSVVIEELETASNLTDYIISESADVFNFTYSIMPEASSSFNVTDIVYADLDALSDLVASFDETLDVIDVGSVEDAVISGLSLEIVNGKSTAFEYTSNADGTMNRTKIDPSAVVDELEAAQNMTESIMSQAIDATDLSDQIKDVVDEVLTEVNDIFDLGFF